MGITYLEYINVQHGTSCKYFHLGFHLQSAKLKCALAVFKVHIFRFIGKKGVVWMVQ